MTRTLDLMAEEIRSRFKDCGTIAFWGELAVRPGERMHRLIRVEVSEGRVLIKLDDGEPPLREIEVWEPADLLIDKVGRLIIAKARRVRFNAATWDAKPDAYEPAVYLG